MIVYTIILIAAGVIVVLLAILATVAILDSNRQAHYYEMAKRDLKTAYADREALKAENVRLAQENAALNARNTALVEAMEAKPTQPKRTVRKNSTSGEQQ